MTTNMQRSYRLIVPLLTALAASPAWADAIPAEAIIDYTTGSTSITFHEATELDAYELAAPEAGDWNTENWISLVQQDAVSGWVELSGGALLAEAGFPVPNPITIEAGTTFDLGNPYIGGQIGRTADDFGFEYTPDGSTMEQGTITFVPEPGSLTILGLGALVLARRRRR